MFLASAMLHHSIPTDCFSCRHFFSLYNLCYVAHAACVHVHSVQWRRDKLANYSDLTPRSGPRQYSPNRAKWQLLALMRFLWTKSNSVCLPQCRHQDLSTSLAVCTVFVDISRYLSPVWMCSININNATSTFFSQHRHQTSSWLMNESL